MKKIYLLILIIFSKNIIAQDRYWVSSYELTHYRPSQKSFSIADRILIKQNHNTLSFFDVGKDYFKNRFKNKLFYNKNIDSLLIKAPEGIKIKGYENKDHLTVRSQKGKKFSSITFIPLINTKLTFEKIEKTLYSNKFIVTSGEFYNTKSTEKERVFKFSKEKGSKVEIHKIENYFLLQFEKEGEKIFQILEIANKQIKLLAPNKNNSFLILKIIDK